MRALSVIVPVYQAEAYLEACVRSVLTQDFSDFELFLIDDGSTDGSGAICDKFAAEDARVRVIHGENVGMSAARNRGLKLASGEYLAFLDADDWLEPGAFSYQLRRARETDADLVLCGYYLDAPGAGLRRISTADGLLLPQDYGAHLAELKSKNLIDPSWNKLYRAAFLRDAGLQMPVGEPFEDTEFNLRALLAEPKIALCDAAFYHYMQRQNGNITRRFLPEKRAVLLRRADLLDACAERFPAPGLAEYCAFYRVKSTFSALADDFLPAANLTGKARLARIREALADESVRRAAKIARGKALQDKWTVCVARSGSARLTAAYCRCVYLLKYKLKNLFFRVKK